MRLAGLALPQRVSLPFRLQSAVAVELQRLISQPYLVEVS